MPDCIWTDWIAHDGSGIPPGLDGPVILWIEVEQSSVGLEGEIYDMEEDASEILPHAWDWSQFGKPHPKCGCNLHRIPRILRYRLRRSPEVEKLRERIVDLPVVVLPALTTA